MSRFNKVVIGDCTRKRDRARGHKQALKLFPNIGPCVKCGNKKSERHHIDDNPLNNSPKNIMPLCRGCHTLEHGKSLSPDAIAKGILASAKEKRARAHCHKGHAYADNVYITPEGKRVCKTCRKETKRRYRGRGGRG